MSEPTIAKRPILRWLSRLVGLMALAVAAVAVHYTVVVRRAHLQTPALIAAAYERHGAGVARTDLTPEREAMLLAIEDPAFYRHHGVDLATPGAGMTTITQGLAKQLYFPGGFKPGVAKIRQTLVAQYALDATTSKDDQLTLLLNIAYFGHEGGQPVHGFGQASRTYYGKEFKELSDDEFLSLVAMFKGPNVLKPRTVANAERVGRIRRYLAGSYHPVSLMDLEYSGVPESPGPAGEALMALLRLVTDARPR